MKDIFMLRIGKSFEQVNTVTETIPDQLSPFQLKISVLYNNKIKYNQELSYNLINFKYPGKPQFATSKLRFSY